MSPDAIVQIVTSALGIVAAVAPGVLAAALGPKPAEAAIAAASARVRSIRTSPAISAIDAQRIRTIIRGGPRDEGDEPVPQTAIPVEHHLRTPVLPVGFSLRATQPPPGRRASVWRCSRTVRNSRPSAA